MVFGRLSPDMRDLPVILARWGFGRRGGLDANHLAADWRARTLEN
jgi:hypothetical protein